MKKTKFPSRHNLLLHDRVVAYNEIEEGETYTKYYYNGLIRAVYYNYEVEEGD